MRIYVSYLCLLIVICGTFSATKLLADETANKSLQLNISGKTLIPSGIWPGGQVNQLQTQGNFVYLLKNDCFMIWERVNGSELINRGQFYADRRITSMHINDGHVVLHNFANGDYQTVLLDISDPSAISQVTEFNVNSLLSIRARTASYFNNFLYFVVARYEATANIFAVDMHDPTNPTIVDTLSVTLSFFESMGFPGMLYQQDHMFLLWNGVTRSFPIAGIEVLDVSNPASPVFIADYGLMASARRPFIQDNKLYVFGGWVPGVEVIDISNPGSPSAFGLIYTMEDHVGFVFRDNIAIFADGSDGMRVMDITDYNQPVELAHIPASRYIYQLGIIDEMVFALDYNSNLKAFDISDPVSPQLTQEYSFRRNFQSIAFSEDYAFVTSQEDNLLIFDISRPEGPIEVNALPVPGTPTMISLEEATGFVATEDSGVYVLDISNAPDVSIIARFDTPGQPHEIVIKSNLAFIADGATGLLILDITDVSYPVEVGRFNTPGNATAIDIKDDIVYLADRQRGFRIIDIANVANPTDLAHFETFGIALDVTIQGSLAFIADGPEGLRILDFSDYSNITEVGFLQAPGTASSIVLQDTTVYLATGTTGVRTISVNDVTLPFEFASYEPSKGTLSKVSLHQNSIYAAGSEAIYSFSGDVVSAISPREESPIANFKLAQNYPNPFNPTTQIAFQLVEPSQITLDIFDVTGRHIKTLANKKLPIGKYNFLWDGLNGNGTAASSGVYLYRLSNKEFSETRKMLLLR